MNRELMEKAGFGKEMKLVENRQCPICETKINPDDFKNDISLREFIISGMCQKCQDKIFGEDEFNDIDEMTDDEMFKRENQFLKDDEVK